MAAALAAPVIGAVAGEGAKAVYNFVREYTENLKICKVFGGLYPSGGFLTLDVGYCIGAGGERKNKKLYVVRLAKINGGAPFPTTEDDKYIVALFMSQMALLKEEIIGQKMRHWFGRGMKDNIEEQVRMDIFRLVIYVIYGALHHTRFIPRNLQAAADVLEKKRRPSDEDQGSIDARFTPAEELIVSVFLSCDPEDGKEHEDYTDQEFVARPEENVQRYVPVSSLDIEEELFYAETESSSADSTTSSSVDHSGVKEVVQQLKEQVQALQTQLKTQAVSWTPELANDDSITSRQQRRLESIRLLEEEMRRDIIVERRETLLKHDINRLKSQEAELSSNVNRLQYQQNMLKQVVEQVSLRLGMDPSWMFGNPVRHSVNPELVRNPLSSMAAPASAVAGTAPHKHFSDDRSSSSTVPIPLTSKSDSLSIGE